MDHRPSSAIDRVLRDIARPQLGLITTAQALAHDVPHQALSRRRASGMLVALFPSVFALAGQAPPHQRALAGALAIKGSTIAGPTAAAILGLPIARRWLEPDAQLIVTVPPGRVVRISGIAAIRRRSALPSRRWHGVNIATPASTIALLAGYVGPETLERCIDHCLVHRLTTAKAIRTVIDTQPLRSIPKLELLQQLLASRTDGLRHRSKLEQRVGKWLNRAGLVPWSPNHKVVTTSGDLIEVDFAWPHRKVALEVSPFFTHGTRDAQERDLIRRRYLTQTGWQVVEATDPDFENRASFDPVLQTLQQLVR